MEEYFGWVGVCRGIFLDIFMNGEGKWRYALDERGSDRHIL